MRETLDKCGNNLVVKIPAELAEQLQWDEHTEVTCTVMGSRLMITPASIPVYTLEELVAGLPLEDEDNEDNEISTGQAVGEEAW